MGRLRLATPADAAGMRAIYAPIVERSATSFELEPPSERELAERVERTLERFPWLVCEGPHGAPAVLGYAYATSFRARPAYDWTVETSVYVHPEHQRRGVARALYTALLACLRVQGFHRAIAGVALPNEASVAFHERLGFAPVGVFPGVGHKHGGWHAVGFWDLVLQELGPEPPTPRAPRQAVEDPRWAQALAAGAAHLRP